uniref:Secreted protein n=1 Tax=Laticauda laticaudata TaxID=8630 RepID=A0A8C5STV5_LATLA
MRVGNHLPAFLLSCPFCFSCSCLLAALHTGVQEAAPLVPLLCCCHTPKAPESAPRWSWPQFLLRTQDPHLSPLQTPGLVRVLPHCLIPLPSAQAAGEPQHRMGEDGLFYAWGAWMHCSFLIFV